MAGFVSISGVVLPTANLVTPQDFGAQADGDDDTVSLQQWLDEPDMIHWLPTGTYVTDPLLVPENCWIDGPGTLKLRTQSLTTLGDHALLSLAGSSGDHHTGSVIRNITLDPNRTAHSGTINSNMEGLGLDYCDGVIVDGVKILNSIADAIDLDNSTRCHITRCYVLNAGKSGIHFSGGAAYNTASFNYVSGAGAQNTDRAAFSQVNTGSIGNMFLFNQAVSSNKGYEIVGDGDAIGVGNIGRSNTNADTTTGADSWT